MKSKLDEPLFKCPTLTKLSPLAFLRSWSVRGRCERIVQFNGVYTPVRAVLRLNYCLGAPHQNYRKIVNSTSRGGDWLFNIYSRIFFFSPPPPHSWLSTFTIWFETLLVTIMSIIHIKFYGAIFHLDYFWVRHLFRLGVCVGGADFVVVLLRGINNWCLWLGDLNLAIRRGWGRTREPDRRSR